MTDGPLSRAAELAYKYGRMAKFRHYRRSADILYRAAHLIDPSHVGARRERDKRSPVAPGEIKELAEVILGTMGQCNASCIHCPTGKLITNHVPRTPMPMALFEKIVHGISDHRIALRGQMAFGLHGDGLLDPFVLDRAKLLRSFLPDVPLAINTNAAAYNRARHAGLKDYVATIAIHCESLRAPVYEHLMAPLRLKNVLPKYEQMLADFGRKIRVSVPVSRMNRDELPDIYRWFMERGACDVLFVPLAGRCVDDDEVFTRLAFDPQRIRCKSDLLDYLVVDSDGMVLGCCQDFQRLEPVGDLARDGLMQTLTSLKRKRFGAMLDGGEHDAITTCSKCYGDFGQSDLSFKEDALARQPA